jgi:hypothetical protein
LALQQAARSCSASRGGSGDQALLTRATVDSINLLSTEVEVAMKIIVGAFVAFLLGSALVSTEAEAGCWWNGYNHCRHYYHHGWYHHGWYHGYWYR